MTAVILDDALTMVGPMDQGKIKVAYENLTATHSQHLAAQMCWPVDWFPEDLPCENNVGNAIDLYFAQMACPEICTGQFPPPQVGEPQKEDVLIFSDSYGYCKEIIAQAPPGRLGIVNVQTKEPGQYADKDIKNLISMHPWDLIIYAVGIDPPPTNSVADMHKVQDKVIKLYLDILKRMQDTNHGKRFCVLTVDCFASEPEVHEECGLGLITNCTLFGMTNTARQEVMGVPFQYIDTEWALTTENTKYIAAEIFRHQSFGHNAVRILNKGRYVQRQVSAKPYEMAPMLQMPEDGVIAITGGNGALGIVMGIWILHKAREQGGKKFSIKFLSRSASITDQNMPNWKEVQSMANDLGISVEQEKCDISDQAKAESFVESLTPNLTGFIHSAGVLRDSMLMNQTYEKFDQVLDSKSRAACYIHDALERHENPNLKFFWVFSSVATYGNMGQLNYSASNSWLDGLARHRRALGKVGLAPQWGAWGDVGMAANLDDASRRRMANSPMPYFSNAEGLAGLESLLRSNHTYGCVYKFNPMLVFGMVAGDEPAMQCYTRNFYSVVAPPPPSDPFKNSYTTIAYTKRANAHKIFKALYFQQFWPNQAAAMEEVDEACSLGFAYT